LAVTPRIFWTQIFSFDGQPAFFIAHAIGGVYSQKTTRSSSVARAVLAKAGSAEVANENLIDFRSGTSEDRRRQFKAILTPMNQQ